MGMITLSPAPFSILILKITTIFAIFQVNPILCLKNYSNKCDTSPKLKSDQRAVSNANCNIYMWQTARNDFVSLANVTYHKPRSDPPEALRGQTIRVLIHEMYPYVMIDSAGRLDGFIGNIWTDLRGMLQFENQFIVERDFDVALGKMLNGEADVFLGAVVSNDKLDKATTYSQPYLYNWYHVGFRETEDGGSSDFYLKAFNKELLFASIGLYLAMAFILWGGVKLLGRYHKRRKYLSFPSCFIAVLGGFLNQASDLNIKFYSLRVLLLTALIFGYIIYTSLNAILVSQLTNSRGDLTVNQLDEISSTRGYSLCVRNNSFVYNYFLDDNKDILPKWQNIVNGPGCLDIKKLENLAAIICKPNVIILENRAVIASVYNRYSVQCNMHYLPEHLFARYNFIVYRKTFEHQYLLSRCFKRIKSCGILNHLEEKWFNIRSSFSVDGGSAAMPAVNLYHVSGILIMLLMMILFSVILLVCEIGVKRFDDDANTRDKRTAK